MSATMKLAKVLDELDIGDPPAQCLLMVLPSRRKLVTRRDELLPAQGGAEDIVERVMTSTSAKSLPWRKDMTSNARLCGADQLKKTTIATVRAFKTKLTNAEDDIQQTSLHVCSTSDILRDHLADEERDQLDNMGVKNPGKGTSWQHGNAESHGQNCYPQLKNLAVIDASVCNDSKTDVVKRSNEEGNWNNMNEDSSQKEKVRFLVMFTPRSEAQAQRASQELSTVCEDSEDEIWQLVTQRETSTCSSRLRSS